MSKWGPLWREEYSDELRRAIEQFWRVKAEQEGRKKVADTGARGAVTGGQQMNGFAELMSKISVDAGVPRECIFTNENEVPGYFRPTKRWDFLVVTPDHRLISCMEFKSQGSSYGNNFNNRIEEAVGSGVDFHTALRYKAFRFPEPPWLGYLMLVELSPAARTAVRVQEPHFPVFPEFQRTSYMARYRIFCERLMSERHYSSACVLWTSRTSGRMEFSPEAENLSFERFAVSYLGYITGRLGEF